MKKGFTIIELVISIFVLTIAVVGIFNAFSVVAILTSDSSDHLIGTYLAQEGMELVRNIRDTNWLNMDAECATKTCTPENPAVKTWVDGITDSSACSSTGCEVDYTMTSLSSTSGRPLYLGANGLYGYSGGTLTKFQRKIIVTKVTDVDNDDKHILDVKVQVCWDKKATILEPSGLRAGTDFKEGNNCITVEETLYDWYNYKNQ